ncbi:MAG: hypothetical protein HY685_04445 [Chloroflexi bacterium]|nr:hypothetical protein [Chloroflexota bacterium]
MIRVGARLLLAVLFFSLIAPDARAQEPVEIVAHGVVQDFPVSLTFSVGARSAVPLVEAVLMLRTEAETCVPTTTLAFGDLVTSPENPSLVTARWRWDLRRNGDIPPGARIFYAWRLHDVAGNVVETPEDSVVYEDQQRPWRTVSEGLVTVRWYEGSDRFAQQMVRAALGAVERLEGETEARLTGPVTVYVYPRADELRAALIFAQEWTGGVAFPEYRTIVLAASPSDPTGGTRALAHEISHLVMHQATFSCSSEVPSWLDEGLATYNEGVVRSAYERALQEAVRQDSLFPFRALVRSFPTSDREAILAYAQSRSLIEFLLREHRKEAMGRLLSAFREGVPSEEALLQAYGMTLEEIESRWRGSLGLSPRPVPTLPLPAAPIPTIPLPDSPLLPPSATPPSSSEGVVETPATPPIVIATQAPSASPERRGLFFCNLSLARRGGNGEDAPALDLSAPLLPLAAAALFTWRRRHRPLSACLRVSGLSPHAPDPLEGGQAGEDGDQGEGRGGLAHDEPCAEKEHPGGAGGKPAAPFQAEPLPPRSDVADAEGGEEGQEAEDRHPGVFPRQRQKEESQEDEAFFKTIGGRVQESAEASRPPRGAGHLAVHRIQGRGEKKKNSSSHQEALGQEVGDGPVKQEP